MAEFVGCLSIQQEKVTELSRLQLFFSMARRGTAGVPSKTGYGEGGADNSYKTLRIITKGGGGGRNES